jgi:predicted kinase
LGGSFVPAAHLIHGYLGAGKTTFARRLERNIPAIRFSHDEWVVRFYGNDPPIEHFADYCRRVYEQVEEIWPRCLELGVDVVLDFGFGRGRKETRRGKNFVDGCSKRIFTG